MKLTKEEQQKLIQEILDDLPDNFSIFPPWLWLFLVQLFSLKISGIVAASALELGLSLSPPQFLSFCVFVIFPMILVPNIILATGRMELGIKLIRLAARIFFFMAILGFIVIKLDAINITLQLVAAGLAYLTHFISYTVKFQAFALHRSQMAAWSKERIRKNKAFKNETKKQRK